MNRPNVDACITRALAALLHTSYTEDVPTEAECDAIRGHVATLNECIKQYQRRVDELEAERDAMRPVVEAALRQATARRALCGLTSIDLYYRMFAEWSTATRVTEVAAESLAAQRAKEKTW